MSFEIKDVKGGRFRVETTHRGDNVMLQVGNAEYYFTSQDARYLAAALEYFANCAEMTGAWRD